MWWLCGCIEASDIEFNNFYYGSNIEGFWLQINFIKWSTTFIMQCKTILKVLMVCKVRLKVEETLCVCLCERGSYIYTYIKMYIHAWCSISICNNKPRPNQAYIRIICYWMSNRITEIYTYAYAEIPNIHTHPNWKQFNHSIWIENMNQSRSFESSLCICDQYPTLHADNKLSVTIKSPRCKRRHADLTRPRLYRIVCV